LVNLFWGKYIGDKRSFPGGDEKSFSSPPGNLKNWGKRILSGDERIFFGDE
jgi:hypothetical protein